MKSSPLRRIPRDLVRQTLTKSSDRKHNRNRDTDNRKQRAAVTRVVRD
jgi:hypothetical protein